MIYGQRPDGMTDAEWTVETQCRHVAREMRKGKTSAARGAIFDEWQKILPAVTKQRVGEIWRSGVPMPGDTKQQARGRG